MREKKQASKIKTIIISILAAIFVWAAVTYINPPQLTTTISNLPIRFTGREHLAERGLTIVGKDDIPGLAVTVKGRKNDLLAMSGGIFVEVDVSTIDEDGEYELAGNVTLPSSALSIKSVKFSSVPVTIDKLSSKDIPITVAQTGGITGKLIEAVPQDEYVTITGAVSEINAVSYGEASIDVSKASDGSVIESGFLMKTRDGTPISKNETISASKTQISITCKLFDAVTLPVKAILADHLEKEYIIDPDNTSITPSSVEVGVRDKAPQCVYVRVDSTNSDTEGILEEADGMYIPEASRHIKIKTDIKKRITRNITVNVTVRGLDEGLSAHVSPVQLSVSGAEEDISPDNIKAYADVSGLTAGEHTVPVVIESKQVSVTGSYTATVNIT